MSQIARLKDSEISNGNLINADDIDSELNQLVSESNSQDTRLTSLESSAMTIAGVKTFSSTPKMDQIDERTSDVGVTLDGVLHKDGYIKLNPATQPYVPAANGELGYDSTNHAYKIRVDGTNQDIYHAGNLVLPVTNGYSGGKLPVYTNSNTITIPAGFTMMKPDGTIFHFASDTTVALNASGAGGLVDGSDANNTHYYLYAIKKSSDGTVSVVASTVNETASGSITLPSGYDLKTQIPLSVYNDDFANIIPFAMTWMSGKRSHTVFRDYEESATYRVLNGGSSATFSTISLSILPETAIFTDLHIDLYANGFGTVYIRATGSGLTTGRKVGYQYSTDMNYAFVTDVVLSASRQIDYRVPTGFGAGDTSIYVYGWTEEVA